MEDKEYLASNQVVGGSNPSGRAKFFNDLGHLTKSRVSEIIRTLKVVIDSSNTMKHQKGEDRNVHIRMDLLAGPDKIQRNYRSQYGNG